MPFQEWATHIICTGDILYKLKKEISDLRKTNKRYISQAFSMKTSSGFWRVKKTKKTIRSLAQKHAYLNCHQKSRYLEIMLAKFKYENKTSCSTLKVYLVFGEKLSIFLSEYTRVSRDEDNRDSYQQRKMKLLKIEEIPV